MDQAAAQLGVRLLSIEEIPHNKEAGYSKGNVTVPATINHNITPEPLGEVQTPPFSQGLPPDPNHPSISSGQPVPIPDHQGMPQARAQVELTPAEPEPQVIFPNLDTDVLEGFMFTMKKYSKFSPENMLLVQLLRDVATAEGNRNRDNTDLTSHLMLQNQMFVDTQERLITIQNQYNVLERLLIAIVKMLSTSKKAEVKKHGEEILKTFSDQTIQAIRIVTGKQ